MTDASGNGKLSSLFEQLKTGQISRRTFMERALALGVALPVLTFVVNSLDMKGASAAPAGAGKSITARLQDAPARPLAPDDQVRGAGGELKILQWQAVTTLSLHHAQGTKDQMGASLITEPLMSYLPDGTLIPTLVKEVPTKENGGLSDDLKTVTYHLREDILWSDGTPFTSADVVATYNWIMDPAAATNFSANYLPIEGVEAPDDYTVIITFKEGSLAWYIPFSGSYLGAVYAKHVIENPDVVNIIRSAQIGTGPYKVESFRENDQVVYTANENYRDANKPYFATINLKGGGDAVSAARAVLETGDWNVAWNLQVEPSILNEMVAKGKGQHIVVPGTTVERLALNFSDPNKEVDGQRSEMNTPHPYMTDPAVRQALAYATDRDTVSAQFYAGAPGEPGTANILVGIGALESPNTSYEFNLDKARETLDAAGWVQDGDVRKKDGVELNIAYATTINAVRQKTQAVNKKNWEDIGIKVQLKQIDAGIFFDSSEGNEQNLSHFYYDMTMYADNATSPFPVSYMKGWYGGEDGWNIAQKSNKWVGNAARWSDPEYDALFDTLGAETDAEQATATFIKLNDILISNNVVIPIVQRAAETFALTNNIDASMVATSSWEVLYWNMANWHVVAE
jgi:peptide/nickel transport system substrate-binding protein